MKPFALENIPQVMRDATRWIPVKLDYYNGTRWSKLPLCQWSDERTYRRLADVRGHAAFVVGAGFVTVDWDRCVVDGVVDATVLEQVRRLNSYAEISLSGTGVHAVAFGGPLPPGRQCEMWDAGHYVVITGHHIAGTPTNVWVRQNELVQLAYDLTPGGLSVAERAEYVVPTECFRSNRTREMFRYLRSLQAKRYDKDTTEAWVRMFDITRCEPSKIAEKGEAWFTGWFNRSWNHADRRDFNRDAFAVSDEVFTL